MSSYITQIIEDQPQVYILGGDELWNISLSQQLRGAKFDPIFFSWKDEGKKVDESLGLEELAKKLLKDPPYAVIWIDVLDGEKAQQRIARLRNGLRVISQTSAKVLYVQFEAVETPQVEVLRAHNRCNVYALEAIKKVCRVGSVHTYNHVIVPVLPGISLVNMAMSQAITQGEGIGKGVFSPLWYEDCVSHIVQSILLFHSGDFTFEGEQEIEFPEYLLALLRKIQKKTTHKPQTQILVPKFRIGEKIQGRAIEDIINLYTQEESIRTELLGKKPEPVIFTQPQVVSNPSEPRKKRVYLLEKKIAILASLVLGVYVLFFISTTLLVANVSSQAKIIFSTKLNVKNSASSQELVNFRRKISLLSSVYPVALGPLRFAGQEKEIEDTIQALSVIQQGSQGIVALENAQNLLVKAYKEITDPTLVGSLSTISTANEELNSSDRVLATFQARIEQQDFEFPSSFGGKDVLNIIDTKLLSLRKQISSTQPLLAILPTMIGSEKKQSFAILLQDSNELRSSGGVIEAVGIVTFDKGKLLDVQVHTTKELDTLLNGIVDPPDDLKQYLQKTSWNLSYANWDSDFAIASQKVAWFIEKETQTPISGVIAVNTQSLSSIVSVLGSLELENGQNTITPSNFDYILSQHPEAGERQVFMASMLSQLLKNLQNLPEIKIQPFWLDIGELATTSQILFGSSSPDQEVVFSSLGWAGDIISPQCPSPFNAAKTCRVETFFESENSIGTTRVNGYITRNQTHTIHVDVDKNLQERVLTMNNSSPVSQWPLGDYQAIISMIINDSPMIQEVDLNGQVMPPTSFQLKTQGNSLKLTLLVSVPAQGQSKIRVLYTTPGIPSTDSALIFFEQKQSGTLSDPITYEVDYPNNFTPKSIAPTADVGQSKLLFTSIKDQTKAFAVGF